MCNNSSQLKIELILNQNDQRVAERCGSHYEFDSKDCKNLAKIQVQETNLDLMF